MGPASWLGVVLLSGAGCVEVASRPCDQDAECAPYGAVCIEGRCRPPTVPDLAVALDPDGGADAPCAAASECLESLRPICDPGTWRCRACGTASDGGVAAECAARDPLRPFCATGGACVQCLTPEDCSDPQQGCDQATGSCGPCQVHQACSSLLCEAGSCADPATLLYVSAGGPSCPAGPGAGTRADPYCRVRVGLDAAAGAGRTLVVLTGTYVEDLELTPAGGYTVRAVGVGAPVLSPANAGRPVVGVANPAGAVDVTLDGFVLIGGSSPNGNGLVCLGGAGPKPKMTLLRSTVRDNVLSGVYASYCDLTLDQVTVGPGNADSGITMSNADFAISNTLVLGNGTGGASGSQRGGIYLMPGGVRHLLYNLTVVDNRVGAAALTAAGLHCAAGLDVANVVVAGNVGGLGELSLGSCKPSFSAFPGAVLDSGNLNLSACGFDALFAGAASGDYHPKAGSLAPCSLVDVGTASYPGATIDHDRDGRPRPLGAAVDIGAYELP